MTSPTVEQESQSNLEATLIERERQRRDALVNDDIDGLSSLLADDLVHVHTTGMVHSKADMLVHAGKVLNFLSVERGPLTIRRLGADAAVMTGPMINSVKRRDADENVIVKSFVTQVWVRRQGEWQIASFQATRLPPDAP